METLPLGKKYLVTKAVLVTKMKARLKTDNKYEKKRFTVR